MPYPPKRTYRKSVKRALTKRYGSPKKVVPAVRTLQAAVRRLNVKINKTIETKQSILSAVDGQEIAHNNFIVLDNVLLQTTQGVQDPTTGNNNTLNRIGDQITLKGIKFKMMFELNHRYSDVTFRILVIRSAKGDTPDRSTLFRGNSGNKILDTVNNERYSVIQQKYFKIKASNTGSNVDDGAGGIPQPSGYGNLTQYTFSRATKYVSFWIDGKKIVRNGIVQYENGTGQPKFYDYHVVVYAYSNYTTLQDVWNVARLNDYVKIMYYKDA